MYLKKQNLKNKIALVTGAGKGLGKACAIALAEAGANIIVISRTKKDLDAVSKIVKKYKSKCKSYVCDVTNYNEIKSVIQSQKRIDILVNNAGMSPLYPSLSEVSEALFDKVVSVNLKGPFRLMANVGERMMNGGGGAIINISSTASVNKSPTSEPYGAAKAGLNNLTRSFAAAYGQKSG